MNYNIRTLKELITNPVVVNYKEFKTGITALDRMLTVSATKSGIRTSRLYTILGCTGSGKSLFMLGLSQLLSEQGASVLYISLENTEDQTYDRLMNSGMNITENLFLSHPTKNPNFGINDNFYANDVRLEIQEVKSRYNANVDVVVLDYLGEVQGTSGRNSYEEMGDIMTELKELAKELNVAIITASQCNREALKTYKQAKDQSEMLAALSNINESHVSDSAKIIHISDFVWFVHRVPKIKYETFYNNIGVPGLFVSVLKNRDYISEIDKAILCYRRGVNSLHPTRFVCC